MAECWVWCGAVGVVVAYATLQAVRLACGVSDLVTQGAPKRGYEGVVVWVTGASSGIGAEMARQLVARGAKVVISARGAGGLEATRASCADPARVVCVPLDLTDVASHGTVVQRAVAAAKEAFGEDTAIDVLVNNGGRSERTLVEEHLTSVEVERTLFEVNFFGTVSLTKAVLRECFLPRGAGRVVNVSSVGGKTAAPCGAAYSASKHALQGWADSLRAELAGTGVSVCNVCPGPVATPLGASSLRVPAADGAAADAESTAGKMPVADCVALMCNVAHPAATAITESWISPHPVLLFLYLAMYTPSLAQAVGKSAYAKRIAAYKNKTGLYDTKSTGSVFGVIKGALLGTRKAAAVKAE